MSISSSPLAIDLELVHSNLVSEVRTGLRAMRTAAHEDRIPNMDDPWDPEPDVALTLLEMRSRTAQEVEEAAQAARKGLKGICRDCGESIPENRLRAKPHAIRCVECQEIEDDREKHRRARRNHRAF